MGLRSARFRKVAGSAPRRTAAAATVCTVVAGLLAGPAAGDHASAANEFISGTGELNTSAGISPGDDRDTTGEVEFGPGDPSRPETFDRSITSTDTGPGSAQSEMSGSMSVDVDAGAISAITSRGAASASAGGDTQISADADGGVRARFELSSSKTVTLTGSLDVEHTSVEPGCVRTVISIFANDGFNPIRRFSAATPDCPNTDVEHLDFNEELELTPAIYSVGVSARVRASPEIGLVATQSASATWNFDMVFQPECIGATSAFTAADESCPNALSGRVTDGHGQPMVGVPVQLLDPSETPLGAAVTTDGSGNYVLPPDANVPPGEYALRVALIDAETNSPRLSTHYGDNPEPVQVKRPIDATDFSRGIVDIDITNGPTLTSNLAPSNAIDLDDVAVIHRRSKQYVDFLTTTFALAPEAFGQATVRAFRTPPPNGCGSSTACYVADTGTVFLGQTDSSFNSRSTPNAGGPENVEWHELTHHFAEVEGIANKPDCNSAGDRNHGGYKNSSTCDSLSEGFATFLPTYASHVIDGSADDIYATFGSLEWRGWMAWASHCCDALGRPIEKEDFAVAALLWDLADPAPSGQVEQWAARVLPADPSLPAVQVPNGYRDEVEIGFETVSVIVRQQKPQTVKELYDVLQASAAVRTEVKNEIVDLDGDTFGDVSPLDVIFLIHGFHIPVLDDLDGDGFADYIYQLGTPIARTDHAPNPAVPGTLVERNNAPHTPGSEVLLRNDSSGPIIVTITATDGLFDAVYTITLGPGEEKIHFLDLPPHATPRIEPGDPLPPCGPGNDALLSITIDAPGVDPLETDSCEFAHAIQNSDGQPALTYAITPPDGTIKRPKDPSAIGNGIYNTTGAGQTLTTKVKRGKSAVYQLNFENDALEQDAFTITGCRSSKGFKVSYLDDGANVTSQITGAGRSTGALDPGAFEALELRIKVGRIGPKKKSCSVTATSQDSPSLRDIVVGKVKVKT